MRAPTKVAVFVSGEGSLFKGLVLAAETLDCQFQLLVTSKIESPAVPFAKTHQIPVMLFSDETAQLQMALEKAKIDFILLLGFLKKVPDEIIRSFPGRILNTHPSLLPKYGGHGMYGRRVHAAVLKAGESETGCSLHIVTDQYDEGPVISQKKVVISKGETVESLQAKVKALELQNLIETLPQYFRVHKK